MVLLHLVAKMKVGEAAEESLKLCKPYGPEEGAGLIHTATSLQTGAVLITNDTGFDKIKKAGIIKVWSVSKAIKKILPPV